MLDAEALVPSWCDPIRAWSLLQVLHSLVGRSWSPHFPGCEGQPSCPVSCMGKSIIPRRSLVSSPVTKVLPSFSRRRRKMKRRRWRWRSPPQHPGLVYCPILLLLFRDLPLSLLHPRRSFLPLLFRPSSPGALRGQEGPPRPSAPSPSWSSGIGLDFS